MFKYYETKNFLVKTFGTVILMVFITGLFNTSKVFADEPGSVFYGEGMMMMDYLDHMQKNMDLLNIQYLAMLKKVYKN